MRIVSKCLVATICVTLLGWITPQIGMAAENSDCFACHSDKELKKMNTEGKAISLFVDEARYVASPHGKQNCADCHKDIIEIPHADRFTAKSVSCAECHKALSESYGASVHGLARATGKTNAAACKDCHGTHEGLSPASPKSPLNRTHLAATCGACHPQAERDVERSVHGKALAAGVREAPTCTDCHSEHKIEKLVGATPMKISEQVCSRCHSSERISTKFKIPTDRVKTFFDSYHGLAVRLGSPSAANCASCHGSHDVLPSTDPASRIHPKNLAQTCGACHPHIGTRLASGPISIHSPPGAADGKPWIVNFVARLYIVLIVVVVGAMLAHNALDYIVKTRAHVRKVEAAVGEMRLSRLARVQHITLIVLFFLLAYTGFVHKYPEGVWSWPFQVMPSGNYVRGMIHRVAGWMFTGLLIAHCAGLFGTRGGRAELRALWLRVKDWKDVWATLAYNLGLRANPPVRERFNYVEKAEYWALMWGSVVMILTGVMLIFTEAVLHFLPKVWLDVAQVIHFYEAVLATLAIIVWHFYGVIFDPHEYPMNPAWLIGKKPLAGPHANEATKPAEKLEARADAAP